MKSVGSISSESLHRSLDQWGLRLHLMLTGELGDMQESLHVIAFGYMGAA